MAFQTALCFCSPGIQLQVSSFNPSKLVCKRPRDAGITSRRRNLQISHHVRATAGAPSSFGRGIRFPRRLVGLYELERLGVNTKKMIAPNAREELGFGVFVGLTVVATIGVPLISPYASLEAPVAVCIASALVVWAVDTLALNGILMRALSASVQNRRRVGLHEAGHFLVAHLLGVAVSGYELLSARAVLRNPAEAPGIRIDADTGKLDAYMLSAVGMAGISAEVVHFGSSEGGVDDMAEVARLAKEASPGRMSEDDLKRVCRWGLIQGVTLLQAHREALLALADAMVAGRSVEECIALIDSRVKDSELTAA